VSTVTRELTIRIAPAGTSRTTGIVILTNAGDEAARVWRTGSTWGDDAYSFEAAGAGAARPIARKPQVHTRNVPGTVTLQPGGRYEVTFDLLDGTWETGDAIPALQSKSARLVAVYDAGTSPEVKTEGVLPGRIRSEPV
jgi:hypothetical protein